MRDVSISGLHGDMKGLESARSVEVRTGISQEGKIFMEKKYDIFISYAHEDADFALRLRDNLKQMGLKVWIDEDGLKGGTLIASTINDIMKTSKFGIPILTKNYFEKPWTSLELETLFQLRLLKNIVMMPIWHGINKDYISQKYPLLLSIKALKTEGRPVEEIATEIVDNIKYYSSESTKPSMTSVAVKGQPSLPTIHNNIYSSKNINEILKDLHDLDSLSKLSVHLTLQIERTRTVFGYLSKFKDPIESILIPMSELQCVYSYAAMIVFAKMARITDLDDIKRKISIAKESTTKVESIKDYFEIRAVATLETMKKLDEMVLDALKGWKMKDKTLAKYVDKHLNASIEIINRMMTSSVLSKYQIHRI